MKRAAGIAFALGLVLLFGGCATPLKVSRFAGSGPEFDPVAFFTGRVRSWGVFENGAGEPTRRFETVCDGRRTGSGELLLDQTFTYDDGSVQHRHWRIRRLDAHRFEATANDVVGTGTGEAFGNAFRWEYTVALKAGNPLMNVRLKQWMYLQRGGETMINHATVHALGIEVAQVSEFFRRENGGSR